MALLEVENVCKSFGALKAVNDVSFAVEAGEIFGLAGPNGSGKSTLFNVITGIPFGPDSGRIRFGGIDIHGMAGHRIARLGLARSFQRETSFESLSVWENATLGEAYGRAANSGGDGAGGDRIGDALSFVGFSRGDWGRPANELSVYDRKCLMLATAVAMQPRMLLLDELAAGLTKPEIEEAIRLVRRIAGRGIAIVLTEHILTFLMSLSQRLLVLNQGEMLSIGQPEEVMRDKRVVEAYLGSRRHTA